MAFARRTVWAMAQEDGVQDRRDRDYFLSSQSGQPMPNRWATDGLGLIPTILNTSQLQLQLNTMLTAILADLASLKSRA